MNPIQMRVTPPFLRARMPVDLRFRGEATPIPPENDVLHVQPTTVDIVLRALCAARLNSTVSALKFPDIYAQCLRLAPAMTEVKLSMTLDVLASTQFLCKNVTDGRALGLAMLKHNKWQMLKSRTPLPFTLKDCMKLLHLNQYYRYTMTPWGELCAKGIEDGRLSVSYTASNVPFITCLDNAIAEDVVAAMPHPPTSKG